MRQAVVLAGGKGTRLAPYTAVFPKPLMPIGDAPIIDIVLHQLANCGFERVVLAVGYLAELMEAFCGDGSKYGLTIEYCREVTPLGTAGPLAEVEGLDVGPFLVLNGDVLSSIDYAGFLEAHATSGAAASITTYTRTDRVDFGVVLTDADDNVTGYIEKPETEYRVSTGVYAFSPEVLPLIQRGVYLDFPTLVLQLLDRGMRVKSVPFGGYWLDIGRHDDFKLAQDDAAGIRAMLLGEGSTP